MYIKLLILASIIVSNMISYNLGYLQGLSDILIEIKEEIRFDREVPLKGPAAKAIHT